MGIIAICGQKGGSGKTTISLAVAAELHARGERVLFVDADPQGTVRTWGEVVTEAGGVPPTIIALGANMHAGPLNRAIEKHAPQYVIIDCPPSNGPIQRAALMVADLAILPCGQSYIEGWALLPSVDLVNAAIADRPELRVAILLTRCQARTRLGQRVRKGIAAAQKEAQATENKVGKTALDALAENKVTLPILRTELAYRVGYQEFPGFGVSPAQHAPGDPMGAEVNRLIAELRKELRRVQSEAAAR